MNNVFLIPLVNKHVVKKMPPGGFQVILLLEDCVGNGELVFSAELEQDASIVITVTNIMPTMDSFPCY